MRPPIDKDFEWSEDVVSRATHCRYGHRWTAENTYYRIDNNGGRQCRACCRRRDKGLPAPPRIVYTHCINGHKLDDVGTLESKPGQCKVCHRDTLDRKGAYLR